MDAVALDERATVLALGSCKWTNAPIDHSEENLLTRLAKSIPGAENVQRHYFYSRSGFSDSLQRLREAAPDRYELVTPEDIYEASR